MAAFVAGTVAQHPAGSFLNAGIQGGISEPFLFVMLGVFFLFAATILRSWKAVPFGAAAQSVHAAKNAESFRSPQPIHSVYPAARPHVPTLTAEPVEISG
jgi:hypothetical protein